MERGLLQTDYRWVESIVLDIVAAIRGVDDYEKNRNNWKYLKNKLKKEGSQVVSGTTQLIIAAPDGKSKKKAYSLFDSPLLNEVEIGTVN